MSIKLIISGPGGSGKTTIAQILQTKSTEHKFKVYEEGELPTESSGNWILVVQSLQQDLSKNKEIIREATTILAAHQNEKYVFCAIKIDGTTKKLLTLYGLDQGFGAWKASPMK